MIIAGAGGHAIELLSVLEENNLPDPIYFFDDLKALPGTKLFGRHKILTSIDEAKEIFMSDPDYIIGVGNPSARKLLHDKMSKEGGRLQSVISPFAHIGKNEVWLGEGLNIMTGAVITGRSKIGMGTLIHIHCSIHHDTTIGEFCELSPGCRILGAARVGNFVSVGSGAIILPGIHIGDHCVVGAGAVVTKNVAAGQIVVGVPAKPFDK